MDGIAVGFDYCSLGHDDDDCSLGHDDDDCSLVDDDDDDCSILASRWTSRRVELSRLRNWNWN